MADGDKTFTEAEHIAILTDRVAKETAELTTARDALATEKADLQNKLDVAESAKVAAEQAKEKAEQDLVDFQTAADEAATKAARKDERLGLVKEAAAHLGETFLDEADEAGKSRVERIVAMEDEAFAGYVSDLKATVPTPATPGAPAPRQTAMVGAPSTAAGAEAPVSAGRALLLGSRGYLPKENS